MSNATRAVLFVTGAGAQMGGGHAQRCMALAGALLARGWMVRFCVRSGSLAAAPRLAQIDSNCIEYEGDAALAARRASDGRARAYDWLIVDDYDLDARFQQACRDLAERILAFEDQPARAHACDMLLDPTPLRADDVYAPFTPAACVCLLGPRFALLREQFLAARGAALARRQGGSVGRILISMGATDPANATMIALEGAVMAARKTSASHQVDIVLGAAAPHLFAVRDRVSALGSFARLHVDVSDMAALLAKADLALGAGGGSSWERCCLGLPSLIFVSAGNQQAIASALGSIGAARVLGDISALTPDAVAMALSRALDDRAALARMSSRASELIDGRGAERVAERMAA